tara:strand:+ start:361 stop:1524 length:1164 start_codon:yes stop_codon:yes gene_type:complete
MSKLEIPEPNLDHLEFYLENNISPVRQNIADLDKHLERRSSLYQQLGLPSMIFQGKDILEVGPGSGHNSLYVASCKPSNYDLLEPNLRGQADIKELYSTTNDSITKPNLISMKLEDYHPEKEYDIVICECWLGVSDHEREMMKKLGSFIKQGGILITTIGSPLGGLPNAIRRVLGWALLQDSKNVEKNTEILKNAYTSHLDTIKDMSRLYEDWVQDVLINPAFFLLHPSPSMFIEDIGEKFDMYQTYPKFTNEWRFYKSLYGDQKQLNQKFLESYYENVHNFFDYLIVLPKQKKDNNVQLEKESLSLIRSISEKENKDDLVINDSLRDDIERIFTILIGINPLWKDPLNEVLNLINQSEIDVSDIQDLKLFDKIFGRELIYATAIKK